MAERNYGRIVMTTSSGVFGLKNNTSYATAKAAVIGLTRSLAVAAPKHGISVNLIAPAAMTRMAGEGDAPDMSPELVAPMAAFLAHESCPVNGEMYAAGAGRFARIFLATTSGVCPSRRRCDRSRTSPSTGRTSTTKPAIRFRRTSPTGPPGSCPTCSKVTTKRAQSASVSFVTGLA